MASLEATELKLKTTPTGGKEAHLSPYYRKLVSAGYKGFLQGSIGGAALYGMFGLVIGSLVAFPLVAIPSLGIGIGVAASLAAAGAGLGILKGADTFGQIGSTAAINAESADLSEQRRYLLDRYYDLPDGPEGDREAEIIKQELLARASDIEKPSLFHWKTVIVGALVGAALVLAFSHIALGLITHGVVAELLGAKVVGSITALATNSPYIAGACTAALGALAGATIGIDRYYVRKWFDHTNEIIHSGSHDYGLLERTKQVERIKEAAKEDEKTKAQLSTAELDHTDKAPVITNAEKPTSLTAGPVASLDKPVNSVSANTISADRLKGLAEIHKAMELTPL